MIASLNGLVLAKTAVAVILDVNGVGYEVFISTRTLDTLPVTGAPSFLHVQTVVREDAITLYGFGRPEEKEMFLLLVTVSGIGPKVALNILSGISVVDLRQAIMFKDLVRLTTLPGVGKKTAQRICVDLGEKVGALAGTAPEQGRPEVQAPDGESLLADAASALVNLGYPQATAWEALRVVQEQSEAPEAMRVEDLIRLALRALATR
ncbi:MAG: Holliday junction branch migration protein RuvA [Desulfobulbus sp.]|jgi:Holliday junction DNA helicase RuvA|nr:Holliday junction branch migration protein RuvA [Desulfobulbus sp.]